MEISENDFISEALDLYPDLERDFKELEGLLHLQMDRFRYRVEEEMVRRSEEKVLKSFMLAEKCYRNGIDDLKSAVVTSFAEAIYSGHDKKTIKWGWKLFPDVLKEHYVTFWGKNAI